MKKEKKGENPEKQQGNVVRPGRIYSPDNDPQGCYTGIPLDPYEVPVQDQDDL